MAHRQVSNGDTQQHFLSKHDEQSLAEEMAAPIDDARPDNLDVHSDSLAIAQDTFSEMRRPAIVAGVVVGASILLILGISMLSRRFGKSE